MRTDSVSDANLVTESTRQTLNMYILSGINIGTSQSTDVDMVTQNESTYFSSPLLLLCVGGNFFFLFLFCLHSLR